MKLFKQVLILLLCCLLVRFTAQAESFGPTGQSSEQSPISPVQQSPQELQQLVAPIALYPDALVAQVLAASTYPAEIVEADRWMQSHSWPSHNFHRFLKTWTRTSLGLHPSATHMPTSSRM